MLPKYKKFDMDIPKDYDLIREMFEILALNSSFQCVRQSTKEKYYFSNNKFRDYINSVLRWYVGNELSRVYCFILLLKKVRSIHCMNYL